MKTLFVGNGINLINNSGKGWKDVLEMLKIEYNAKKLDTDKIPFPLVYEEIYLSAMKIKNLDDSSILQKLPDIMKEISPNQIHKELWKSKYSNIITTNYDYTILKGNGVSNNYSNYIKFYPEYGDSIKNSGKERKYRLRTCYELKDKKIWHIHGELNYLDTIILGYERYSKVIHSMEEYFRKAYSGRNKLWNYKEIRNSWLDLLFISDIDIVGLSLDFSEIDLWYALNYRARMIKQKNSQAKNTITYYHIVPNHEIEKKKKPKAFIDLLETHHIKYEIITADSYLEGYKEFLKNR